MSTSGHLSLLPGCGCHGTSCLMLPPPCLPMHAQTVTVCVLTASAKLSSGKHCGYGCHLAHEVLFSRSGYLLSFDNTHETACEGCMFNLQVGRHLRCNTVLLDFLLYKIMCMHVYHICVSTLESCSDKPV